MVCTLAVAYRYRSPASHPATPMTSVQHVKEKRDGSPKARRQHETRGRGQASARQAAQPRQRRNTCCGQARHARAEQTRARRAQDSPASVSESRRTCPWPLRESLGAGCLSRSRAVCRASCPIPAPSPQPSAPNVRLAPRPRKPASCSTTPNQPHPTSSSPTRYLVSSRMAANRSSQAPRAYRPLHSRHSQSSCERTGILGEEEEPDTRRRRPLPLPLAAAAAAVSLSCSGFSKRAGRAMFQQYSSSSRDACSECTRARQAARDLLRTPPEGPHGARHTAFESAEGTGS